MRVFNYTAALLLLAPLSCGNDAASPPAALRSTHCSPMAVKAGPHRSVPRIRRSRMKTAALLKQLAAAASGL